MSQKKKLLRNLLVSFLVFFVLVAFVVTCCFFLFLNIMTEELELQLTNDHLQLAAKLTFLNVLFLSLAFSLSDSIRRHYTVTKPVQVILDATTAMANGDFSVRVPAFSRLDIMYGFDDIGTNLNHMAKELCGTETLRTDFISNVSHELKTPLAVMQNYGTLLQQPNLEEDKRIEYAKSITDASRRLAALITNILKLNRLENQQIFPEAEDFDLSEQLCQCLLGFETVWEQKNLDIRVDIPDAVVIHSDPELMELVWNNLLSNAMKFTPEGGCVCVTLFEEEDAIAVSISDTGCGMSAEAGRHIFEKFYQADTSHATHGNGLGLALVKRVVDITGSSITVQSTPGKGSTFTVRLGR